MQWRHHYYKCVYYFFKFPDTFFGTQLVLQLLPYRQETYLKTCGPIWTRTITLLSIPICTFSCGQKWHFSTHRERMGNKTHVTARTSCSYPYPRLSWGHTEFLPEMPGKCCYSCPIYKNGKFWNPSPPNSHSIRKQTWITCPSVQLGPENQKVPFGNWSDVDISQYTLM